MSKQHFHLKPIELLGKDPVQTFDNCVRYIKAINDGDELYDACNSQDVIIEMIRILVNRHLGKSLNDSEDINSHDFECARSEGRVFITKVNDDIQNQIIVPLTKAGLDAFLISLVRNNNCEVCRHKKIEFVEENIVMCKSCGSRFSMLVFDKVTDENKYDVIQQLLFVDVRKKDIRIRKYDLELLTELYRKTITKMELRKKLK